MDPISLAIEGVGIGMQIFGGMGASSAAKHEAEISQDEAKQEQAINGQKQQQMELEARRTQMENIRNSQRARAMATNAAVNQGAQFGSGLAGGLGQISGQSNFNMLGVDQGLQIGRNIGVFNNNISNDKAQMASAQSDMASAQGMASLGGALMKAGPSIGPMAQSVGSSMQFNSGGFFFQ